MRTIQSDNLLTVKQVAQRLSVSEGTIRYWLRNGLVTYISLPVKTGKPAYRLWNSTVSNLEKRQA